MDATAANLQNRVRIIIGVALGSFLAALDTTILSTVMPTIIGELEGLGLYSWVFSVYMIMSAVSMPVWGRVSDIVGKKKMFVATVLVFLLGSVLCGLSGTIIHLIVFRGIQGIGAGGLSSIPFALISTVFPSNERGKALGFLTATWGVSSIIGPMLGSLIVTQLDWRWVFYVNVPGGTAAVLMVLRWFREDHHASRESIDYGGAALLCITIVSLLLVCLESGKGNTDVARTLGYAAIFLASGVAFVVQEKRTPYPILQMEFFRRRAFWTGNLLGFLISFTMFGMIAYLPLLTQNLRGGTAVHTGVVMTAMSLSWSAASFVAGRLVHRVGENVMIRAGMPVMICGLVAGVLTDFDSSYWQLAVCGMLTGLGMGMQTPSLVLSVQNALDQRHIGIATSSQMLSRTIGGAVGISVTGAVVSGAMAAGFRLPGVARALTSLPASIGGRGVEPQELLSAGMQDLIPARLLEVIKTVFVDAVQTGFLVGIAVIVVGMAVSLLLPPSSLHRREPAPPAVV